MNIFLHEIRSYRKSTVIWTLTLTALVIALMSMFPVFIKDVELTKALLSSLSPTLRNAIGIQLETFFSIFGFYSYIFLYIILAGSVQAMNLGTSLISKENTSKTAEFLLTKPVTRSQIVTAKLLAAFALLAITNVIYVIAAVAMAISVSVEPVNMKIFLMISAILLLVQLMFLALGVLVSVIVPKIKSVISVSLPTVFGFFIISMIGSIIGDNAVRYITPFKFYEPNYIINNGSFEMRFVVIEIVFIVAAITAGYIIYARKDIRSI
jgi:ABC-2 type transport system permease protein